MTKIKRPNEDIAVIGGIEYWLLEDKIGPALRIQNTYDPDVAVVLLHFRSSAHALVAFDGAVKRAKAELAAEMQTNQSNTEPNTGENHD
jgi:hypothetical protein